MKPDVNGLNRLLQLTHFKFISGYHVEVSLIDSFSDAAYEIRYILRNGKQTMYQVNYISYQFVEKSSVEDLLYYQLEIEDSIKHIFPKWVKAQEFNKDMKEILG